MSLFPPVVLEEEPPTQQLGRTDIRQVIEDCLRACAKDGLAYRRMENVENCFW